MRYMTIITLVSALVPATALAQSATQDRVLGFESKADWTSPTASVQSSGTHTQGTSSLAVQAHGYSVLTSAAFPVTSAVASTITLDVLLPTLQANPFWFGNVSIFVTAPSVNVFNQYLGEDELTGMPLGKFLTLSFGVPAAVQAALSNDLKSDVTLTIAINVPFNEAGTYLLDNLQLTNPGTNGTIVVSAPGDSTDLSTLGVASWQMSTDLNALHSVLTGFDPSGNSLGTVTIDQGGPFSTAKNGTPATVTVNIGGNTATMRVDSATADCRIDIDAGFVCNVKITGTASGQPYVIAFQANAAGSVLGGIINVSELEKTKRVHLALNMTPNVVARILPAMLNSFCLSCIGSTIAKGLTVAAKWTESGTVKLAAKAFQLASGTSRVACIFQGVILVADAYACGVSAAVDVPAAGTVTPAAVIACGFLVTSGITFRQNCSSQFP